jgi:hypothetical protein
MTIMRAKLTYRFPGTLVVKYLEHLEKGRCSKEFHRGATRGLSVPIFVISDIEDTQREIFNIDTGHRLDINGIRGANCCAKRFQSCQKTGQEGAVGRGRRFERNALLSGIVCAFKTSGRQMAQIKRSSLIQTPVGDDRILNLEFVGTLEVRADRLEFRRDRRQTKIRHDNERS